MRHSFLNVFPIGINQTNISFKHEIIIEEFQWLGDVHTAVQQILLKTKKTTPYFVITVAEHPDLVKASKWLLE